MTTAKQMEEQQQQKEGDSLPPDLFQLVEEGEASKLAEVLEEGQHDLSARNGWDKSLLDIAVLLGRVEIVRCLLTKGGNVNEKNKRGMVNEKSYILIRVGYTLLHTGAMWGQRDCLEALIEAGGDCNGVNKYKETPKDSAARYGHMECVELFESTGK